MLISHAICQTQAAVLSGLTRTALPVSLVLCARSFARFRSTRAVLDSTSTETGRRKIIREYREANERANGGREREDLYTDNWDGDVYKGSPVNVLSVILAVSILAPLVGLIFALQTYGTLWG